MQSVKRPIGAEDDLPVNKEAPSKTKKRRTSTSNKQLGRKKKQEDSTSLAVRSISETETVATVSDNALGMTGYHVTPETPVSDSGIDMGFEMGEIDRFVRAEGQSDVDLVAAAAQGIENLEPNLSGIIWY